MLAWNNRGKIFHFSDRSRRESPRQVVKNELRAWRCDNERKRTGNGSSPDRSGSEHHSSDRRSSDRRASVSADSCSEGSQSAMHLHQNGRQAPNNTASDHRSESSALFQKNRHTCAGKHRLHVQTCQVFTLQYRQRLCERQSFLNPRWLLRSKNLLNNYLI